MVQECHFWNFQPNVQEILIEYRTQQKIQIIVMVQNTARKMSKYGVFSGPYFPVFGQYSIQIRENTDQKKTPY